MIAQLSNRTSEIPQTLVHFYYHNTRHASASHHPTSGLAELLAQVIEGFSQVYIIIDALDECVNRDDIVRFVDMTMDWKLGKLHWLVTSRTERDIEEHMVNRSTAQIPLQGSHIDVDIHSFILGRLQNDPKLNRLSKEVKEEIEGTLMKGAQGMFRWVACQIDALSKCSRLNALQRALRSLPKTLDETYTRILAKINENDCQDALNVLQWLSFSIRPVRLDEVAEALSIDWEAPDSPSFTTSLRLLDIQDVLVMCSSLVTTSRVVLKNQDHSLSREIQEIRLAHFSVKEFLISERIRNSSVSMFALVDQSAHAFIAQCCIVYLLQFEVLLEEYMLGQSPLAHYAARYWIDHVKMSHQAESSEIIHRLALELLQPDQLPYANWCRLFDPDKPWKDTGFGKSSDIVAPLYYTSMAGFQKLSSLILERGDDPKAKGGLHGYPLQAAALNGHEGIVQMLLCKGADINKTRGLKGCALVAATQGGHESIVSLLLEKGAEVNTSGFGTTSALQEAVVLGDPKITRLLLHYGAKVGKIESKSGKGLPLEEAVARGYDEIIFQLLPISNRESLNAGVRAASKKGDWRICQELLNRGADVNLALYHAAGEGFKEIVQNLLDKNADVNAAELEFRSDNPLVAAAIAGHESIVQQLLANGADGSKGTYSYVNALQAAATYGKTSIVQLFLDAHVDVNARGKRGTALAAAVMHQNEDTVMLLLKSGADPNLQGEYGTPLYHAASSGQLEIVQELLKRGADINSPRGTIGAAIQAAAYKNHLAVVQYLIERGAEINTNNESQSALQSAAYYGSDALVELLLSAGADMECQDGYEGSPLRCAIYTGRLETVRLLIEKGADVNRNSSISCRSESPLRRAVLGGDENIVRFLLENGAKVNDQDDAGFTALHVAARAGNDKLLPILVDEFGADLQLRLINGSLGIHSAAIDGAETCLEFFLDHGLEVDSKNFEGRTPLHFAAEAGQRGIVQLLLDKGANRELAESKTGMTALDFVELHLRTIEWFPEGEREEWEEMAKILR
ncbi:MAG: hypothetical protein M1830_003043, partial [Pleopsidium flavum]